MRLTKRKIISIIGFLLSILFLYLAVRKVDFHKTFQTLSATNYYYLIPAVFAAQAALLCQALQWKLLLSSIKKCRYINFINAAFTSCFFNAIFPMRCGEIIVSLMLGEKEKIPKATVLGAISLEKIMNSFAIVLLLIITLLIFPVSQGNITNTILFFSILLLIISITFLYCILRFQAQTLNFIKILLKIMPLKFRDKINRNFNSFIIGLEIIKKNRHIIPIASISILQFMLIAAIFFFLAKGMGIPEISYFSAVFIMTVIVLGTSIPVSPGQIGIFEYFGIISCTSALGIPKNIALGYIALVHIVFYSSYIIALIFVVRENISLFQVEKLYRSR